MPKIVANQVSSVRSWSRRLGSHRDNLVAVEYRNERLRGDQQAINVDEYLGSPSHQNDPVA